MTNLENAAHILVNAGVRYWEDASVDGEQEDNDNPRIFGAEGDRWKVKIRLADGQIEGWASQNGVTLTRTMEGYEE